MKDIKSEKSSPFMGYTFFNHISDVKFRAEGETLEEMFVFANDALEEIIRGDIKILGQEERVFEVEGTDNVDLLFNFLERFLFLLEDENFLVAKIKEITISNNHLKCVIIGDNAKNYKFTSDVKSLIRNGISVKKDGNKFSCQVVLDVQ